MRKVKLTKQNVISPKAVFYGLSIKQIVIMAVGVVVAILTFLLLSGININITMSIIFIELFVFAGLSIVKINGMSFFRWIYCMMKGPIYRPYKSKGMLDTYAKKEEKK